MPEALASGSDGRPPPPPPGAGAVAINDKPRRPKAMKVAAAGPGGGGGGGGGPGGGPGGKRPLSKTIDKNPVKTKPRKPDGGLAPAPGVMTLDIPTTRRPKRPRQEAHPTGGPRKRQRRAQDEFYIGDP